MKRLLFAAAVIAALSAHASPPLAMMESTVQVHVSIEATVLETGEKVRSGWVGSGVVYANDGEQSLILSANHVLETPAVGSIQGMVISVLGMEFKVGQKRIDAVEITVTTNASQTCNLEVLKLGVSDYRDVATGKADCDAGRVAKIARSIPARGEQVYISGHPAGVPLPVVTVGYVSGYWDVDTLGTFLLVSAGATGGNSGGPVFYNGEVIGLLVRGSRAYPNISLVTPLEQVLLRIEDTPTL